MMDPTDPEFLNKLAELVARLEEIPEDYLNPWLADLLAWAREQRDLGISPPSIPADHDAGDMKSVS